MNRRDCLKSLILGLVYSIPDLGNSDSDRIRWNQLDKISPRSLQRRFLWLPPLDLKFAMEEMIQEFQKDHPEIIVKVTYGSSGNFYSQLSNQAPFDLFFSADIGYPRKLSEQGLILPGTEFLYGVGQLVLWVPKSSLIDVEHLKFEAVRHESVHHIALANPKHAPYGKAAEAALRSAGLWEAVQSKIVLGENVSQAFQFIQSGNAEIGIVALSLALAPGIKDQGRYWQIPLDTYPRLEQGGVILKWTKAPEAAQNLRRFVTGSKGRSVLKRYGFYLPGER